MANEVCDPIMISALEHYSYCPRQCGLIHLEQVWDENLYTMRGRDVHENVDKDSSHERTGVRYERALPIWSRKLGLVGKADLVEFHGNMPYPVEYKSGKHRAGHHEALQLCAQAACLEEMFDVKIEKGALYWHGSRERKEIPITEAMRAELAAVASSVHELLAGQRLPPPVNDKRCKECSLKSSCLPHVTGDQRRSKQAARELFESLGDL